MNMKGERFRMKGQIFLIAGFLLAVMFFAGLPKPDVMAQTPTTEDLEYIYENIEHELCRALTLGMNESAPVDTLKNFTSFTSDMLETRYISLNALWVVSEGNKSTIINVSVGNFLDSSVNITLNLTRNGGTQTIEYLDVSKSSEGSAEFHSVTEDYNLTIIYNDESYIAEWKRDKLNLYCLLNLTRGENIKKEEFSY